MAKQALRTRLIAALAAVERFLSPGLSTCMCCRRPWRTCAHRRINYNEYRQLNRDRYYGLVGVESHDTPYGEGRACFPLCETCWAELSICQREPYYKALVLIWQRDPEVGRDYSVVENDVLAAVRAGR